MNVEGKHYRTIWLESPGCVRIIDQALLPHEFAFMDLRTPEEMCRAIRKMHLRGAGLIGAAAPERNETSRSDDGPPFSTATF